MKVPLVALILLSCCATVAQQQSEPTQYPKEIYLGPTRSNTQMTVQDVVRLSQAGVSDDVIVRQIQKKGPQTDLSTGDILRLKNAGVSNRVIQAMADPNGSGVSTTATATAVPATPPPPATSAPQQNATHLVPVTLSPPAPAPPVSSPPNGTSLTTPSPANDGKMRVYVSDRPITEVISMIEGGSYGSAHASGFANGTQASYSASGYNASSVGGIRNDQRGGADPRTLEVSGDLSAECHVPNLVVTSNPAAADYILDFRRRGGTRSTWFVFGGLTGLAMSAAVKVDHAGLYKPNGDMIVAAKARTVGGAVKEICPYFK